MIQRYRGGVRMDAYPRRQSNRLGSVHALAVFGTVAPAGPGSAGFDSPPRALLLRYVDN